MGHVVFAKWLNEPRAVDKDSCGRTRVLLLDNLTGHNETPAVLQSLQRINGKIRKLPKYSTNLCQPLHSFVIQKIKKVWRAAWEKEKLRLIQDEHWSLGPNGSGKLKNPGKSYYLKLVAQSVQRVNDMEDTNNISYPRKAMIRCGLALEADGVWRVEQLFPHLQNIVEEHHMNFCG